MDSIDITLSKKENLFLSWINKCIKPNKFFNIQKFVEYYIFMKFVIIAFLTDFGRNEKKA